MKKWTKFIITTLLSLCLLCLGYYAGKHDGISEGITAYQNCIWNGATGWYVEGDSLRCIF